MKCLNTRAKLIIQQLYESMFHEPYMLTEGSHAKINNNPAFMPGVIEKSRKTSGLRRSHQHRPLRRAKR